MAANFNFRGTYQMIDNPQVFPTFSKNLYIAVGVAFLESYKLFFNMRTGQDIVNGEVLR